MLPNMSKGTPCVNPNYSRPCHIPQMQWRCPPKINFDSNWHVASGEESTEAVSQRRGTTDPRPSAPIYPTDDNADDKTPVIPLNPIEVEEEASLQNNSSAPFLPTNSINGEKQKEVLTVSTPVTDNIISAESVKLSDVEKPETSKSPASGGDMMAVAMAGAAAALTAYESRQDEQTSIDIGLLMQFLSNPDTVHKLISEQSFPGIEPASTMNKPTLSVPFASSNPNQLKLNPKINGVPASTGVVISKPDATESSVSIQSSKPEQGAIDIDLLGRLLKNPKVIEDLIKEYYASDRSGSLSASMIGTAVDQSSPAIAISSDPLVSHVNTIGEDSSPTITGVPFPVPHTIYSSVFTASTKMSLIDKELPYLETTMAPMSPLYSSRSANMEPSVMMIERLDGRVADGIRMESRPRTSLKSPVLQFSSPQLSGFPRASVQPNVLQSFLQVRPVSAEVHTHPALRVSAPVAMPGTKIKRSLGLVPSPRTEFILSKANSLPAANIGPLPLAFSHPNPLMQAVAHPENHGNCISDRTVHGGFGLPRASFQPTANVLRSFQQMIPVSPVVYRSPALGANDPICMPVTKLMTSLGIDSSPGADLFTLPKANSQPTANMGPLPLAFSHTNPLLRAVALPEDRGNFLGDKTGQHRGMQRTLDYGFLSLHDNSQVVGQGLSLPKPQKPCIYFNTPKGCWNGTSCPYMHIISEQTAPSRVEALHGAKRMKLG
ncbi:C3H1-type domain-containing protein [Heracleum sosnowskyi]|uniref:C3H1-type domain-containing protein n=1 Tax=Heracleum sosnowskyi TaxID=360622 RepID=A0AAD8M567_9APIA|nr:C3H1-type domain-containing protein [Heracleum sosnowskyi]